MNNTTENQSPTPDCGSLSGTTGSALSPKTRLACLIAREISGRFYLCTDKGIGGDFGYSPYWVDEDDAVEKLVEIILPLLPNKD